MRFWCALALSLALTAGTASAQAPWPIPEGIKTVDVGGYPMAYQETGSGPPLVLVHGSINDYRIWYAQVPEFAKKYRVISVSLRHYYPERWDGKGSDFSVEQHAADVASLIEKLQLGKVHLLGHSRGGAVVLNTAHQHPELIRTLILEDASGMEKLLPETPESQKLAAETKELVGGLRRNMAEGNVEKAAQEFVDGLGGPGTWGKRSPEQRQLVLDNMGTGVDSGERGKLTCEDVAKFDFPILTLTGERSPKRYGEAFAAMRTCNPEVPAAMVIPNAAHAMNRENPPPFNEAVLEFLARH